MSRVRRCLRLLLGRPRPRNALLAYERQPVPALRPRDQSETVRVVVRRDRPHEQPGVIEPPPAVPLQPHNPRVCPTCGIETITAYGDCTRCRIASRTAS